MVALIYHVPFMSLAEKRLSIGMALYEHSRKLGTLAEQIEKTLTHSRVETMTARSIMLDD